MHIILMSMLNDTKFILPTDVFCCFYIHRGLQTDGWKSQHKGLNMAAALRCSKDWRFPSSSEIGSPSTSMLGGFKILILQDVPSPKDLKYHKYLSLFLDALCQKGVFF